MTSDERSCGARAKEVGSWYSYISSTSLAIVSFLRDRLIAAHVNTMAWMFGH